MTAALALASYVNTQPGQLEQLIDQHAPLVKRIAHHLLLRLPSHVQVDDLIQSGMIGLLEAAKNFDGARGARFETYAGIRIRGAMLDDLRKGDWVPRSVHRNSRRISEAIKAVEDRSGRDARDHEVADELGVSIEEYNAMLADTAGGRLFGFDDLAEGASENLAESLHSQQSGPYDHVAEDSFKANLSEAISQLPEREQLVLALYYDEELNLKEIGAVLGVSESRVCQIHSQAAGRLRARLGAWHG